MSTPAYYLHVDVARAGWGVPEKEYLTYPGYRQDKKDEDIAEANRILDEVFGPGVRPRSDQYVIQLLSRREISVWGIEFFKAKLGWEFDVKYVDTYGNIGSDCLYTIRAEANPNPNKQTYIVDPSDAFWGVHSKWKTGHVCEVSGYKTGDRESNWAKVDPLIEELDTSLDQARRHQLARQLEIYMVQERTFQPSLGTMNTAWANLFTLKGVHWYNLGTYSQQRITDRLWLSE